MTGPARRPDPSGRRPDPSGGPPDPPAPPEQVLAQALRAMVGGPRDGSPASVPVRPGPPPAMSSTRGPDRGWTTLQVLLLAALIGLTTGVVGGLLSLLLG